jgi:hypothetical protein
MKPQTGSRGIALILYVQVTVHPDNLRINNQQDASSIQNFILSRDSTCFGHLLCPSSGVTNCTRSNWHVSCRLCNRCLGESGSNVAFRDKIKFWILDASCMLFTQTYSSLKNTDQFRNSTKTAGLIIH